MRFKMLVKMHGHGGVAHHLPNGGARARAIGGGSGRRSAGAERGSGQAAPPEGERERERETVSGRVVATGRKSSGPPPSSR